MHASNQGPLNNIGGDPRNLLILACHGSSVGSALVAAKFDAAVATLDRTKLEPAERYECVKRLGEIFQSFIESGNWKYLDEMKFDRGLEGPGLVERLDVGVSLSKLLTMSRVSVREESFREQLAFGCLRELFGLPLNPTESAPREMEDFLKNAPGFIDRIIELERLRGQLPQNASLSPLDIRYLYRADELALANLKLLIENDMPARVAIKVTECLVLINKQSLRDEVIDMWKWFANSSLCSTMVDENRLPEPLGRSGVLGAMKLKSKETRRFDLQGPTAVHQFPVALPSNPAHWEYFAQRLSYLQGIKDTDSRDLRMSAYVVSFREFVASLPFYRQEERHFRRMNLEGVASSVDYRFYTDDYGVDNGPGPEGSDLADKPLRETASAFRFMAAARYGLNVRKSYTRTIHETGKWLFEHMAEELKGGASRYRYREIEAYPGSGVRMFGLDIRNALDLSSSQSRMRYLKACPWIGASLRAGHEAEYHLTRGFKAISRTLNAEMRPLSREWRERGSYDGEPYSAMIFNDHFHNDRLPEVRMWLVPERAFLRKIVWAIENNVDINRLDITPEGIAEEADDLELPIFDVGCSCARWGSFANAWAHGSGPAHEWERYSGWAYSRWQSPRHVHRAMASERYSEHLTREVGQAMTAARVEHDKINRMVNFFLDLHSSFLTMEEAWAKGYANAEEEPAREELPPDFPGWEPPDTQPQEDADAPLDLQVRRPRTRMLEHFLQLRNQVVSSSRKVTARDLPSLELQYTRLFARQKDTPYISGADMLVVFPDGRQVSLLGGKPQAGEVVTKTVEMNERIEALWDEYFVSMFAPNNCPRIILP
jgi:hypothetical protein